MLVTIVLLEKIMQPTIDGDSTACATHRLDHTDCTLSKPHLEGIGCPHSVRQLGGQGRGHGVKVEGLAAIVNRHLPALAWLMAVAKALQASVH